MKLRFWRREKEEEDSFEENNKLRLKKQPKRIGVDFASKEPTTEELDESMITHSNNEETLASKNMDFPKDEFPDPIYASDDDIFDNQCLGTAKKTGKRCERITVLGFCWQHQSQNGDE